MYKVIKFFTDLKDNGYAYKVGDIFPRDGIEVSEARIAELSSNLNRRRTPLIEVVPEPGIERGLDVEESVLADEVKEIKETEAIADEAEPKKEPPKKRERKKNS